MPETAGQAGYYAKPGTGDGLAGMLLDIHGERLDLMNAHNVEHFVLVPSAPLGRLLPGHLFFTTVTYPLPPSCQIPAVSNSETSDSLQLKMLD